MKVGSMRQAWPPRFLLPSRVWDGPHSENVGNEPARRTRCLPTSDAHAVPLPSHTPARTATRLASRAVVIALLASTAAGCSSLERLRLTGEKPPLSAIENPTTQSGYKPVQMPMPAPQSAVYNPNSLWRSGSRAFFKDQRAHQIGDILTVTVNITDKAAIDNETSRSRTNKEDSGVTDFLGSKAIRESRQPPCCRAGS